MTNITLDSVRDRLMRKAYLYGDPVAYEAGVEAALALMAQQTDQPDDLELIEVLSATR